MILALLMYAFTASTFVINKFLVTWYTTPAFLVGTRFLVAGLGFLTYGYFFEHGKLAVKRQDWPLVLSHALIAMFGSFMLEMWAIQYVDPAKTCLLFNLSPFITAIIAYFWVSHTITPLQIAALVAGFLGFVPLLQTNMAQETSLYNIGFLSIYEIALLIAVVAYSYGWLTVHQLVVVRKYPTMVVTGWSMLIGSVLALVTSWYVDGPLPVTDWPAFTVWLLLLVLLGNAIVFNLYGYLLKHHSPTFMNLAGFTSPIFAAFYDRIFFGRTVSSGFYVTLIIVFCALVVFYSEERRTANSL